MEPAGQHFALTPGPALELRESGLLHPAAGRPRLTPWLEITHVALDARRLHLGSVRGCWRIPRAAFASPGAAADAHAAIAARLAAQPDGAARRARQEALDRRLAASRRPLVGWGLAALAVALFALGRRVPALAVEGAYWAEFGAFGEPWRLVTAHLLHATFSQLVFNVGLLVLTAASLERQLGTARALLVLLAAALGATLGCAVAGYDRVVGASGLVAGAAGGLLALEMLRPDLLPAPWRLPRRWLVGGIVTLGVSLLLVPNVAHAAHAGGLAAGAAAAWGLAPRRVAGLRANAPLRLAAAGVLGGVALALGALAYGVADPDRAATRRAERLLADTDVPALTLNNYAWTIAISERPSPSQLDVALRLARRAVRETLRRDPNLLDTLAEVYFQVGRRGDALETIGEAIALAPGEPYFREQRRRFAGERAPEDRPAPPGPPALEPWFEAPRGDEGPGLAI